MKNILKKIGVLVLAIAVLIPFVEFPKVNAATENCTKHLLNYLFLDVITFQYPAIPFGEHYNDEGYRTYTHFPFTLDVNSGVEIKNLKVTHNNLENDVALENYWKLYSKIYNSGNAIEVLNDESKFGKYLVSSSPTDYDTVTTLTHGEWDRVDDSGKTIDNSWPNIEASEGILVSIQDRLGTNVSKITTNMQATVFSSSKFYDKTELNDFTADYIKDVLISQNDQAKADHKLWYYNETAFVPVSILRKTTSTSIKFADVMANSVIGFNDETTNKTYVFNKSGATTAAGAKTDSYVAYVEFIESYTGSFDAADVASKCKAGGTCSELTTYIKTDDFYTSGINFNFMQAYYWPAAINVEYEACTSVSQEWNLVYDKNTDDNTVTNMPSNQKAVVKTSINIDSKTPSRTNYTFKQWCTEKNGGGTCYNAGQEVKNNGDPTTVTLYAIWGDTTEGENTKTGVVSYIIGFIIVGLVAGSIYLIAKKKNLFRQI